MKCLVLVLFALCQETAYSLVKHNATIREIPSMSIEKQVCKDSTHEITAQIAFTLQNPTNEAILYSLNLPEQKATPPRESDVYNFEFDTMAEVYKGSDHCSINSTNTTSAVIFCSVPEVKDRKYYMYFYIKGSASGAIPHIKSIKYNNEKLCANPSTDFLDNYHQVIDYERGKCGNRIIDYTDLIFNGMAASPGEWPWHAAIYRLNTFPIRKYAGAGTLIKENFVLTAAHAVTKENTKRPLAASDLMVILGKFYFEEPENTTQEIKVLEVIVHEKYNFPKHSDNDIALLKLLNNAVFNTHVQPACVYFEDIKYRVPAGDIFGSVVGWGIDETISLSRQLKLSIEPERRYEECVRKDPFFYGEKLTNSSKFCAGWGNGTSPCNGDSGGGFMVFIPEYRFLAGVHSNHGAWFVKGIVTLARTTVSHKGIRICDPNYYVIYTDVSKYSLWIGRHMLPSYP